MKKISIFLTLFLILLMFGCGNVANNKLDYDDFPNLVLTNIEEVNLKLANRNDVFYLYLISDDCETCVSLKPTILTRFDKEGYLKMANPHVYIINVDKVYDFKELYKYEKSPALLKVENNVIKEAVYDENKILRIINKL